MVSEIVFFRVFLYVPKEWQSSLIPSEVLPDTVSLINRTHQVRRTKSPQVRLYPPMLQNEFANGQRETLFFHNLDSIHHNITKIRALWNQTYFPLLLNELMSCSQCRKSFYPILIISCGFFGSQGKATLPKRFTFPLKLCYKTLND